MFDCKGKKILVTGATGGIGEHLVKSLCAHGAIVCATGRSQEKLTNLQNAIDNDNLHTTVCDLLSRDGHGDDGWYNLVPKAYSMMDGLDGLICNAGMTRDGLFIRMKDEDWQDVLHVNLYVTFILNKNASLLMMKERKGRIINISSVVAHTGNAGQANYVASKAGIIGMSKTLAQEIAKRNVTVNCISPGFIKTSMTDAIPDKIKDNLASKIPMGYIGEPSDVTGAALYLLSDAARYVTGTTLHVNGGLYMQ